MIDNNLGEAQARFVDMLSVGVVAGALANALPSIAALFTIVWTMLRIYEMRTVQRWLGRAEPKDGADE